MYTKKEGRVRKSAHTVVVQLPNERSEVAVAVVRRQVSLERRHLLRPSRTREPGQGPSRLQQLQTGTCRNTRSRAESGATLCTAVAADTTFEIRVPHALAVFFTGFDCAAGFNPTACKAGTLLSPARAKQTPAAGVRTTCQQEK